MAIILLDTKTINRIAAGEVIDRPSSIVKELVENAIDAKSSKIEIEIESGGRNLITVIDNGSGVERDDLELAFMRHATSKLNDSDLIEIRYLGFRGEALPAIAAISRIKLSSRAKGASEAWSIRYEGGEKMGEIIPYSLSQGTYIKVQDLFFATPNKLKFLKTERSEIKSIVDIVNIMAIINYDVTFTLTSDSKELLKYARQTSLFSRLCEIEKEFQSNSLQVYEEEGSTKLTGYICKPTINRSNSDMIYTFVNRRSIKNNLLVSAIRYSYHDFIPKGRYPFAALHLEMPPDQLDVNVHPNKSEVRFQNKRLIYKIVTRGVIKALSTRIKDFTDNNNETDKLKKGIVFYTTKKNCEPTYNSSSTSKSKEVKNWRKFCGEKLSTLGNQLMKDFFSPGEKKVKSLLKRSASFDCASIQKSLQKKENIISEREEQIDLIKSYPLGLARCQIYNSYIIAEAREKLIIVDQHAAHERLLYESLKQKSSIKKQKLLLPETIEVKNQAGTEMVEICKDKLYEIGLDIEIESKNKFIVKAIPTFFSIKDVKETLINIVDRLSEVEDTLPIEDKVNKILATIACYGAIRAGRKMKLEEMNELLRKIERTPYSGQCNHGRPTFIEMKLSDIEKLFERR